MDMGRLVFLKDNEYIVKYGDYKSLDYLSNLEKQIKTLSKEKQQLEHKLKKTQDKVYYLMMKNEELKKKKSIFKLLKKKHKKNIKI